MRNAIVQLPETRTTGQSRQVFRAAIGQLDRGDIYVAAVAYMGLGDRETERAVNRLRTDIESLRRHLAELSDRLSE